MSEGPALARLSIRWSLDARAELRAIDRQTALDILHSIDRYLATRNGDVKRLEASMTGFPFFAGRMRQRTEPRRTHMRRSASYR